MKQKVISKISLQFTIIDCCSSNRNVICLFVDKKKGLGCSKLCELSGFVCKLYIFSYNLCCVAFVNLKKNQQQFTIKYEG